MKGPGKFDRGGENELYDRLMAIRPAALSLNAWAVKAGVNRTFFNDVRRSGNARHDIIGKLLDAAGVTWAEFEAGAAPRVRSEVVEPGIPLKDVERAWRGLPQAKAVPHLGSAYGGEIQDEVEMTELHLAEVLEYLPRPPSLANDDKAYALTTVGESMAPRFEPGERVYVSPRAPVGVGDDVIVQLRGSGGEDEAAKEHAERVTIVLIKRLVKRTAKYVELRQFNPAITFTVLVERIAAIHRVMGRL